MITGVWLSPEGASLAVQFDEDEIVELGSSVQDPMPMDEVPVDWRTLLDLTDTEGQPS